MKLVLGGVAATFALWGVGDMFRGGISGGYALKAGDREVSLQEYRDELTLRYGALRQVMGGSFTPEMAKRLGIQQQVLNDLQTGLLVQLEAEELGLKIPESEILKSMRSTAAFQTNGTFNKDSFEQALRRAGISEQRYVESLNKEVLSKLILQNFSEYTPDLTNTARLFHRLRNEKRDVVFYRFTPKVSDKDLPKADERALADYHQTYGEQFRVPEYRKLSWVTLKKDAIAEELSVDDEALQQLYEEHKQSFTKPEQREVSQLLYGTREEAEKAVSMLGDSKSFAETIKAVPPRNEMLSLGIVSGNALPEEARDDVFALEKGGFTKPIETSFGWHVFRVENITPQEVASFDSVREKLKQEWLHSKIEDAIYDLTVELEDSLTAGISLEEAAKELGLTTQSSEWVDAMGQNPDGKQVTLPKQPAGLLSEGFKLADETDSSLIDNGAGDYVLIALQERRESYIPKISELGDKVETAWKELKLREAQREKASKLTDAVLADSSKLNSDLFRPLRANNIKPSGTLPSAVISAMTELPPGLRQDIFGKPVGGITDAYLLDHEKGTYVLAKVTDIDRPSEDDAADQEAVEKIVAELQKQYGEDMLTLYLQHLARKYPVEINQQAIAQLSR